MTREQVVAGLRYIANSPSRDFGGFDEQTVSIAQAALQHLGEPPAMTVPDGPGMWEVRWSDGEQETVEVVEENGHLFWHSRKALGTNLFPVGPGWGGKWRRA